MTAIYAFIELIVLFGVVWLLVFLTSGTCQDEEARTQTRKIANRLAIGLLVALLLTVCFFATVAALTEIPVVVMGVR